MPVLKWIILQYTSFVILVSIYFVAIFVKKILNKEIRTVSERDVRRRTSYNVTTICWKIKIDEKKASIILPPLNRF